MAPGAERSGQPQPFETPPDRPRGGRFEPLTGSLPSSPTVPDRHIFRVGSDGAAQPTGTTAPREPSRAIAPLRKAGPPAVEPPPPSLTVPIPETKRTKPARRPRRATSGGIAGELEGAAMPALPAPEPKPKRTRKAAVSSDGASEAAAPKRTRAKKAESDAEAAPAKKPRARKAAADSGDGAAKPATARKRKTSATAASSKKKA